MTLRARLISFAVGCLLLAGIVAVALLANGGSTPSRPGPPADRRDGPQRIPQASRRAFPPLATRPTRPTQIGYIEHEPISESSGIVASRRRPGVLWTHCDSGNDAALYAITREGSLLAEYEVQARNDDWEDIAADDHGNLYIADTGNNGGGRKKVQVYRLVEPDPAAPARKKNARRIKPTFSWTLRYPASPFDSEAFFVLGGHGYLISKAPGIPAAVYRFALDEGKPEQVLERVCTLPIFTAVTAADATPDGKRLAVLSLTGLHVFPIDSDVARAAGVKPTTTRAVYAGIESAAFLPDAPGAPGGVIVTSEGREIFLFPD
jgi:hypothetical protein